jgi:hypothetical protein
VLVSTTTTSSAVRSDTPVAASQRVVTPAPDAPVVRTRNARNDTRDALTRDGREQAEAQDALDTFARADEERRESDAAITSRHAKVVRASVERTRAMVAPAPPDGYSDAERAARQVSAQLRALAVLAPGEIAAMVVGRIAAGAVDVDG